MNLMSFLLIFLYLIQLNESYNITFGPCTIYYNEASCNDPRIKFYFYDRYGESPIVYDPLSNKLPINYNKSAPLKVILHGYMGSRDEVKVVDIRSAYLEASRHNVMMIDYKNLVNSPCYPFAYFNTYQIGQCVGDSLVNMMKTGISNNNIHLIGFSLGAHISATAANRFSDSTGMKLGRITGLDTADPLYDDKLENNLDKGDAQFVDIIHTNAGHLGKQVALGHVDFYVNGGSKQLNCDNVKNPNRCSHEMATTYFAESIRHPVGFLGQKCQEYYDGHLKFCRTDWTRYFMGERCPSNLRGVIGIITRSSAPYSTYLPTTY